MCLLATLLDPGNPAEENQHDSANLPCLGHVKSPHEVGGGAAVIEVERVAEGVVVEAEPVPAPSARPRQVQPPDSGAQPPVQAPHQVPAHAVATRRRGANIGGLHGDHHRTHSVTEEIVDRRAVRRQRQTVRGQSEL
jgi:hypothetical protein